jgi:transposase
VSSMSDPTPTGHLATSIEHDTGAQIVLGVDTHKDTHTAAVVNRHGVLLGVRQFATTAADYTSMLDWAISHGPLSQAGVEGTHSYGAALTRHLQNAGISVLEVNQPDKAHRRRRGKTDAVDAEAAARAVLSGRATATAKTSDGDVERIRMFTLAKTSAVKARTQAINQLKAVLIGTDPALRDSLRGLTNTILIRRCAAMQATTPDTPTNAAVYTLRLLALRIIELTREINELVKHLTTAVNACTPELLERRGVGPDTAAALLLAAGDNPHRLTNQAAFAALCGVSPVEASSGKTRRHRLNRGGDRHANWALHTIVINRLRWDARTHDYVARRTAEGKTRREIIRCLKRYIAREVFALITNSRQPSTT